MNKIGRNFGTKEDYENLRVSGADLYWHGKKIQRVGWTRGEKLTLGGIIVTAILALLGILNLALINWDKIEPKLCAIGSYDFCPDPQAPGVVTPDQIGSGESESEDGVDVQEQKNDQG
ncbi:MAG: hypothetical protein KME67_11095 [Candidatus Thiodiazotropha sp. (ex Codakia orbicularis)]|nr:hypothetical protein [Candidatus Thiodiazotropha sp. (ex Codakia orbicularis)]